MIVVVIHDPESREQVAHFLEERGYNICVPRHRQDVPVMVRDMHPHMIILDLYVSEPSGIDVLKELRRQEYTGKMIVIAGASMRSVMPQASQLGVDQVIGGPQGKAEPFYLDQLDRAIRHCFHRQISERAYARYQQRGQAEGDALTDWFEAERQLLKS